MADQHAALRSERQVVAEPFVLHEGLRDLERVDDRTARGIADRQAAHGSRGRQVVLEERRRHREHARDVVEAFLVRFVRRQHGASVDLQPEQIADGVGVLDAVQAVNRNPARIGFRRGCRIQCAFKSGHDGLIRGGIGTRTARRRHLAGSQLRDDFFPHLCVVADLCGIERVELQGCRFEPRVVAGHTVPIEDVARAGDRSRGAPRQHGRAQSCRHDERREQARRRESI
jgi:hypothetical protein